MSKETKDRLALRMEPQTKQKIEQWCGTGKFRSQNEFVEKAVNFYADCLAINSNDLLPKAIVTAIDGRISMLEDKVSAITFTHAVELDMIAGLLSDAFELSRDDLKRRRAESVKNVKRTNGRVSLEKRSREREEVIDSDEDEDAWPD